MDTLGKRAKAAAQTLALRQRADKDAAIHAIADALDAEQAALLEANAEDIRRARANGIGEALLDRLTLTPQRLAGIANDARRVAELPDPVGEEFDRQTLPNGLRVRKRRTPIGVLGVIYEARPNVTIDIATLALKSGNAAILRGGSETLHSNMALMRVIHAALQDTTIPVDSVLYVDDPDRAHVLTLLRMHDYVDMIIPRGGAGLHQFCRENATIPVITGGIGICHLYVDASADEQAVLDVIHNAKVQRPSVCNALDTLLVHESIAATLIPAVVEHLGKAGVHFRVDEGAAAHVGAMQGVSAAGAEDWDQEWLSLVLGIRIVPDLTEAIMHIRKHSTGHSDGILTQTDSHATRFVDEIDSAAVYVNASTRFTDGSQLGLGAEVAISTQKLHARGPMALTELTTYKWIIEGDNHIR